MDEKVLSYGDVVLRTSDLEILRRSNAFINDRIIEFYFIYLLDPTEQHEEEEQKHSNKNTILLLPPVVAFWISHCPGTSETLRDSVDPLLLPQREVLCSFTSIIVFEVERLVFCFMFLFPSSLTLNKAVDSILVVISLGSSSHQVG